MALTDTVAPMALVALGLVIGALIGELVAGLIPDAVLKVGLGVILIVSARRTFHHTN